MKGVRPGDQADMSGEDSCVCVGVCMRVCVFVYVCMHICMYVFMHVCMHPCVYLYLCACVQVHICLYVQPYENKQAYSIHGRGPSLRSTAEGRTSHAAHSEAGKTPNQLLITRICMHACMCTLWVLRAASYDPPE